MSSHWPIHGVFTDFFDWGQNGVNKINIIISCYAFHDDDTESSFCTKSQVFESVSFSGLSMLCMKLTRAPNPFLMETRHLTSSCKSWTKASVRVKELKSPMISFSVSGLIWTRLLTLKPLKPKYVSESYIRQRCVWKCSIVKHNEQQVMLLIIHSNTRWHYKYLSHSFLHKDLADKYCS